MGCVQAEDTKWAPVASRIYMYITTFPVCIACQIAGSSQYSEITVLGEKKRKKEKEREKFDSELEGLMVKRMFFWE